MELGRSLTTVEQSLTELTTDHSPSEDNTSLESAAADLESALISLGVSAPSQTEELNGALDWDKLKDLPPPTEKELALYKDPDTRSRPAYRDTQKPAQLPLLIGLPAELVIEIFSLAFANMSVCVYRWQEIPYRDGLAASRSSYAYSSWSSARDGLNLAMKFEEDSGGRHAPLGFPFAVSRDFQQLALSAFYPTATFRFKSSFTFMLFCNEYANSLPDIRRLEIQGDWTDFSRSKIGRYRWAHVLTRERLSRFTRLEGLTLIIDTDNMFRAMDHDNALLLDHMLAPIFRLFRGRALKRDLTKVVVYHHTRVKPYGIYSNVVRWKSLVGSVSDVATDALLEETTMPIDD